MSRANGRAGKPYERSRPKANDGKWVHDKAPGLPVSVVNSARTTPNRPAINTKLVVSNLHYNIMPKDLISIFGQIGTLVREPVIKYDRSGRSTGIAYISYETVAEATRAKNQFNGILAKGQPMSITYDNAPLGPSKGAAARRSANAPSSLVDRISKPPLLDRLAAKPAVADKDITKDASNSQTAPGPVRNRRRRGGPVKSEKFKKEPKTAEDLDKELEDFMADDDVDTGKVSSVPEGDVEMSA